MRFRAKLLITIAIIISVIIFLNVFQKETKNFFFFISSPIQKAFWLAGDRVSDFLAFLIEAKSLKKEAAELRLKNLTLIRENIRLQSLEEQNQALREALKVGLDKDYDLIVFAHTFSKVISEDTILIDKGSEDGLTEKLPVITENKVLCGRIKEVYKNFSKVELISNKNSSFDVKLENIKEEALAKGEGNFNLLIDFIPFAQDLKEGTLVVSSDLGGVFPANFLVGEIKSVLKSNTEPFQKAKAKMACDLPKLGYLFIIR